jgi:phosphohistidine phosphatase SixA
MSRDSRLASIRGLLPVALLAATATTHAAAVTGAALVDALRQGGCVLVMRHASSPFAPPEKSAADPANVKFERQLDGIGRSTARAMGEALRQLRIPVGEVLSSPTYRALETVRIAALGRPTTHAELDEGAQGMGSGADPRKSAWLRAKVAEQPRAGTNTFIVTHTPNIVDAFGAEARGIAAGETLVFRPGTTGPAQLIARLRIEDWPQLAGTH